MHYLQLAATPCTIEVANYQPLQYSSWPRIASVQGRGAFARGHCDPFPTVRHMHISQFGFTGTPPPIKHCFRQQTYMLTATCCVPLARTMLCRSYAVGIRLAPHLGRYWRQFPLPCLPGTMFLLNHLLMALEQHSWRSDAISFSPWSAIGFRVSKAAGGAGSNYISTHHKLLVGH